MYRIGSDEAELEKSLGDSDGLGGAWVRAHKVYPGPSRRKEEGRGDDEIGK